MPPVRSEKEGLNKQNSFGGGYFVGSGSWGGPLFEVAQKMGLSIRRATTRNEMEIFRRLYLSSMERNRAMAKYPLKWFYAVTWDSHPERESWLFFCCSTWGGICGGGRFGSFYYVPPIYLHNGSVGAYLEHRPNDLISGFYHSKRVGRGEDHLDFYGVRIPMTFLYSV